MADEQTTNTKRRIVRDDASFDPVKQDVDGQRALRVVWSTDAMARALDGLQQGRRLVANPFYENNTKLMKADLVFRRTNEERDEFIRCMNDVNYFAERYCKLMTPQGIRNITLRDYQKRYLKHLEQNRLSIFLSCRQSGKTTTSAIYMLHYILFNTDKNALVLGNKRRTAVEILDKVKKIFFEIPYFLKPGVLKWNEAEIVFDNGCRCMAEATTINSGISFTFHCVLADEFAHIASNIKESFYNNLFPTITAGRARFIISSTQNGMDLFYRLYTGAVAHENEYGAFKVDWDEVPEWNPDTQQFEPRDEAWHQRMISNLGGVEAFERQYGTSFELSGNTLISNKLLHARCADARTFTRSSLLNVTRSNELFVDPTYDFANVARRDAFVVTIDISEGHGGDYTIVAWNRLIPPTGSNDASKPHVECVAYFRSNTCDLDTCVAMLFDVLTTYIDTTRCVVSFEYNLFGALFLKLYDEQCERRNITSFGRDLIVAFRKNDTSRIWERGVRMTSRSKAFACQRFKQEYESGRIVNRADVFLNELQCFADNTGNATYSASYGHDDLVMAMVQLPCAMESLQFKNLFDAYNAQREMNASSNDVTNASSYDYASLFQLIDDENMKMMNASRLR